jgi:glycosyltransferase involved in cell wall biosynthesis
MKIAIAISTHNRYEVFKETLKNIKKFAPKDAQIFVVDDGSDKPVKEASFRFDKPQGIAVTKNKCLELCEDADYIFLFDDDVYPKVKDWHLPYIESEIAHLSFTFGRFSNGHPNGRVINNIKNGIASWKEPCGCMLFFTRRCLTEVGGFDPAYGVWGYEHVGLSMRIHNAGLTTRPFMDVENSLDLFYSYDWDQTTGRSVPDRVRASHIRPNQRKYESEVKSKRFIPYKKPNSAIVTCYFTGVKDPQRGDYYKPEFTAILKLLTSCSDKDIPLIVLHDCFNHLDTVFAKFETVKAGINPYFQRWFAIHNYLVDHPEIDQLFCVDATDVEVQIDPFPEVEKGFLYVGDEPSRLNNQWLIKHHRHRVFENMYQKFAYHPLLNAGIVGGYREEVMIFCGQMIELWRKYGEALGMTDMAAMNYVCYMQFGVGNFRRGPKINTEFKTFKSNTTSWFKHK